METKDKTLLFIDGIVNLLLGILLLLFPLGIAELVGAPLPHTHFYPTILGAVIFWRTFSKRIVRRVHKEVLHIS